MCFYSKYGIQPDSIIDCLVLCMNLTGKGNALEAENRNCPFLFARDVDDFTNFLNLWFGEMRTGNNEGVIKMTYRLENFIEKITTPVICVFDGKEYEYTDGSSLVKESFDIFWMVGDIKIRDNKVVLVMKHHPAMPELKCENSFF